MEQITISMKGSLAMGGLLRFISVHGYYIQTNSGHKGISSLEMSTKFLIWMIRWDYCCCGGISFVFEQPSVSDPHRSLRYLWAPYRWRWRCTIICRWKWQFWHWTTLKDKGNMMWIERKWDWFMQWWSCMVPRIAGVCMWTRNSTEDAFGEVTGLSRAVLQYTFTISSP